jgi:hypothetical protein
MTVQEYLPFSHLTPMENLLAGRQVLPFYLTKIVLTRWSDGGYLLFGYSDITDKVRLAEAKIYIDLLSVLLEELTGVNVKTYLSVLPELLLGEQVPREFKYWSNLENVDSSDFSKLVINISIN